jgi:hypothetical protein
VIEKLDWHGKLLQRAARGETRAHVCADLGIEVNKDCLAALRATYETGGCTWRALRDDGHHGRAYQMNSTIRDWPYGQERQDEHARVPASAREIQEKLGIKVSDGHFDYLLRQRWRHPWSSHLSHHRVKKLRRISWHGPRPGAIESFFLGSEKPAIGMIQSVEECAIQTQAKY